MTTQEIKIGDFVQGCYKYGCVSGIVTKIKKNIVVVDEHDQYYNTFTSLNKELNITISRIYSINPSGIELK